MSAAAGIAAADSPDERAPTREEITGKLLRVLSFLDEAMPVRAVDAAGQPVSLTGPPAEGVALDRGEKRAFNPLAYEVGVLHSGMLAAAEATGDRRFADFTDRRLRFIAEALPYFRAQAERWGSEKNSFRTVLAPAALDDCGAMETALVDARLARVGPDLEPVIDRWAHFLRNEQFRLGDGTLARRRPQAVSVWADDLYMGVPALARLGTLTGQQAYWDDAVRNARQMSARLLRLPAGLYTHGWHENSPAGPDLFWGRSSGWATLALEDLLDALPEQYPGRAEVLSLLRVHLASVANLQSGNGLWHELLDRSDSYLETSSSAMFVYGLAHAADRGWIDPVAYGPVALQGWNAVAQQVNGRGQVENTCVGTTMGADISYYYRRPVSVYAVHGYGPVLLAGSAMIHLLENPRVILVERKGTLHFVPRQ